MGTTSGKQKTRRRIHFLFLPLSFFLVEVFAFLFLSLNTEEFRLAQLWPLAFGALWAAILSGFVRLFPAKAGRVVYGILYFVAAIYAAVQTGYFYLFSEMMWLSDFRYASEGSDYFSVLLSYPIGWWLGLAALMAQDGKRVLVVDMDAQGNCTYTLTGARVTDNTFDRAGVYDMFRAYGISGTQNYISRTQFDNIDIIPANGNTPMAAKQLQILEQSESTSINMFLAMCLAQVAGKYDYILIDTPPSRDVMVTNALMASDFVLIPCVCDDYSRDSVYRTVAMCQQLEHDEGEKIDVLGIILTMVEKTALTEVIRNELRESQLGSKLFAAEIRKGQAVKDSTRLGAPVVLCARSSNPAKDYAKVYAELKTRVEQEAE